nr:hypothetical protein [Tanacetum cinerariifolium]
MGKSGFQLVDEEEQTEREPELEPQGKEYDIERAIQMSLESFQAPGQAPIDGVATREPVAEATRELYVVEGKSKAIEIDEQAAQSQLDLHKPKRRNSMNILKKGADLERTNSGSGTKVLMRDEEQGEEVSHTVALEEKTAKLDEGQAGSDPGKTPESRPPPDDDKIDEDQAGLDPGKSHVALTRPNPEPMHDDFMVNVYPKVQESLKLP